jgi:hypothetical protein
MMHAECFDNNHGSRRQQRQGNVSSEHFYHYKLLTARSLHRQTRAYSTMLVLFETPAGYALFKVMNEAKLASPDELQKEFADADSAAKIIKLAAFSKFADTVEVHTTHVTRRQCPCCQGRHSYFEFQ